MKMKITQYEEIRKLLAKADELTDDADNAMIDERHVLAETDIQSAIEFLQSALRILREAKEQPK